MDEITQLLHRWRAGSREAEGELFARVAPDLRRLAHYMMRGERHSHTMQATELVDEIYFRLVAAKDRDWQNRAHFFFVAARSMRRYLIDYARGRPDAGFVLVDEIESLVPAGSARLDVVVTVDRLLDELALIHPEWCQVVEVKYFLGLTDQETADAMGIKLRTMQRIWCDARQWLFERMEPEA
jgi:RNA polymerase sigma-70 factor, ECF subfamily